MSALTEDEVLEQFVNGAMISGVAYRRDEAHKWFEEWLEDHTREMQARALVEAADILTDGMNLRIHHALRARAAEIREGKR